MRKLREYVILNRVNLHPITLNIDTNRNINEDDDN